jgi:hypothetical protein
LRKCRKCLVKKPLSEFYRNPSKANPDRLRGDCKSCHQVKTAQFKRQATEATKEKMREYGIVNADRLRDARLQRVHGINSSQFIKLLEDQQGKCAICKQIPPLNQKGFSFAVDHDHSCCNNSNINKKGYSCGNCIRGLLCHNCNLGLGNLKDSIELLQNAIQYLQRGVTTW